MERGQRLGALVSPGPPDSVSDLARLELSRKEGFGLPPGLCDLGDGPSGQGAGRRTRVFMGQDENFGVQESRRGVTVL